jgi:hypothetical protein
VTTTLVVGRTQQWWVMVVGARMISTKRMQIRM